MLTCMLVHRQLYHILGYQSDALDKRMCTLSVVHCLLPLPPHSTLGTTLPDTPIKSMSDHRPAGQGVNWLCCACDQVAP